MLDADVEAAPSEASPDGASWGGRSSARDAWWLVGGALGVWGVLFVLRVVGHQAGVDDFLYAGVARTIATSGNPLSAILHTGQTAPLVPLLAAPFTAVGTGAGVYVAMGTQAVFFMAVVIGSWLLARQWLAPTPALVVGVAATMNAGVLAFVSEINFSLAASSGVVWALLCWKASDRGQRWGWSIGLGGAMGAVLLSRSMAPVYAAPLVLVFAVDLGVGVVATRTRRWLPLITASVVAAVLALPWWVVSGRTAFAYLRAGGYQQASEISGSGQSTLTPGALVTRAQDTLADLGRVQSFVVVGAFLVAIGIVIVTRRRHPRAGLWVLIAWAGTTFSILATTSNIGTGFATPVLVVTIIWSGVVVAPVLPRSARGAVVGLLGLVIGLGLIFQCVASTGGWFPAAPWRATATRAQLPRGVSTDAVVSEAAHEARGTILLAINAPVLNVNGLDWYVDAPGRIRVPPVGPSRGSSAAGLLNTAESFITGVGADSYLHYDVVDLTLAAQHLGFRPVRVWSAGAHNLVALWLRNPPPRRVVHVATSLVIASPRSGAVISRTTFVGITATGVELPDSVVVQVRTSGGALVESHVASPFALGWLGGITPSQLAPGPYLVSALGRGVTGQIVSRPVELTITAVRHAP